MDYTDRPKYWKDFQDLFCKELLLNNEKQIIGLHGMLVAWQETLLLSISQSIDKLYSSLMVLMNFESYEAFDMVLVQILEYM